MIDGASSLTKLVLILIFWNVLALAAMFVVRAAMRRAGIEWGPAVVNAWATSTGALTALLFTFTIVTLWNQDVRAKADVDVEAATMRNVARDIQPEQMPLLRSYIILTIAEWPSLCGGREVPQTDNALDLLERKARAKNPAYNDNLLTNLSLLEDTRNRRWQASGASVPNEIWAGLLVLASALLLVLSIAMPDRLGIHVALMLAVGTSIGTLFWVTLVLEYPFCGGSGISAEEIVAILRTHVL